MDYRLSFMIWLYSWSQQVYTQHFKKKKKAWNLNKQQLCLYPEGTLGKALGDFYVTHQFEVMPKLENHDVFHVLTQTNTQIQDEIAMQYLLLGNGKRSLYLFGMIGIGTLLYPEFIGYYKQSYLKGKKYNPFHHIEFKKLLDKQLQIIQKKFNVK